MPAVSQKQREALNAKFGHAWVKRHHFDNKGKLPERSAGSKRKRNSKRDRMIREFQERHGGSRGRQAGKR